MTKPDNKAGAQLVGAELGGYKLPDEDSFIPEELQQSFDGLDEFSQGIVLDLVANGHSLRDAVQAQRYENLL